MLEDLNEVASRAVPVDVLMIQKYGFAEGTLEQIYGKVLAKHLNQVIKEFEDDAQGISGRKEFQTYVAINQALISIFGETIFEWETLQGAFF